MNNLKFFTPFNLFIVAILILTIICFSWFNKFDRQYIFYAEISNISQSNITLEYKDELSSTVNPKQIHCTKSVLELLEVGDSLTGFYFWQYNGENKYYMFSINEKMINVR